MPDVVELVTCDLSYLPVATAVRHLGQLRLAARPVLIALIKPTFELQTGSLVTDDEHVRMAMRVAIDAVEAAGSRTFATTVPAAQEPAARSRLSSPPVVVAVDRIGNALPPA